MTVNLHFLMIVHDGAIARFVSENGVDTLFVDLEWKGKEARQPNAESWKSKQTPADVSRIREAAPGAELLVRLNPLDDGTPAEVEDALARGADCLLLPMFTQADEVFRFLDLVAGRALVVPLFETEASLRALPEIVIRGAIERAHIGLNDLHLDLGMRFMFEPLAQRLLDEPCAILREHAVSFGIGGVARVGEGIIDPAVLLGEHVRLGSTWTILSRSFHRQAANLEEMASSTDFAAEVAALRNAYRGFQTMGADALELNRVKVAQRVGDVVRLLASR